MLSLRSARVSACALFLIAGLSSAQTTPAPAKNATPKKLDPVDQIAVTLTPSRIVTYKTTPEKELHLHVFEPEGFQKSDKRAVFLAIHGGGWVGGEPRRFYPFAAQFTKLGMLGISLEYRLASRKAGGLTPFESVKDARSAVRYIRAHAAELGADPDKIVVCGGSAGGHLAAATALFEKVNEAGDDLSVSSVPNAMVLLFPVIDTSKDGYGNALLGDRWQEIDPLHHVRAGLPPCILFHGTGDTTTPFKGAQAFHDAMLAQHNRCDFVINEGGRHGYLMFDHALLDQTLARTEEFLRSVGMLQ